MSGQSKFDYIVEVESEETLRGSAPDFGCCAGWGCRGVIVTAAEFLGRLRFRLALLRAGRRHRRGSGDRIGARLPGAVLERAPGEDGVVAYQASPRGGVVRVRVNGDRVLLGGQAVTVLRGELQA